MLSNRYDEALAYAHDLHRSQVRKGTSIPYLSHLLAVSALVLENGGTEDQAIAALLHDGPEDCGGEPILKEIERRFGPTVAGIVRDCSDTFADPKPPWRERKELYLAKLQDKPDMSLLVSLADKTHNADAIWQDHQVNGDALWDRFRGGKEGTRWYYQSLVTVFKTRMPGPLCERFSRAVEGFQKCD